MAEDRGETSGVSTVRLVGHLTADALQRALMAQRSSTTPGPLLVDCREMTGYDLEARHVFVEWNKRNAALVTRVAIVTTNTVWLMVISAMSLASGRAMKAFDTVEGALAWLR